MTVSHSIAIASETTPVPGWYRPSDFLNRIEVTFGPQQALGQLFLVAERAARNLGVYLGFEPFDMLLKANAENRDTWLPLIPIFDDSVNPTLEDQAFCIVGRNAAGEIVATQAGRLYNWPQTTYYEEAINLRLFFADAEAARRRGEQVRVTAEATKNVKGKVLASGGGWYHPRYRGTGLGYILPRLSRAFGYTRWNVDYLVTTMSEPVFRGGFWQRAGYSNYAWSIDLDGFAIGNLHLAFLWMNRTEIEADILSAHDHLSAQFAGLEQDRRAG